jgi:TolA-binding protein
MPTNTEEAVPAGFDPIVFWMENKSKIITYAALLLAGLAAFAAYQISTQHNKTASEALFAQAVKPDEFRQVIQKYPRSIAAGNAQLMLAEALRSEKKFDEALATLRDFVNQFPDHPLAAGGALGIATTLESQGKIDEAFDAYQQVSVKYSNSYAAPVALMAQGNILAAKGKTEDAKRTYENVVSQFPESIFSQQAMQSAKLLHK